MFLRKYFVKCEQDAVKNSFITYVWSTLDLLMCCQLYFNSNENKCHYTIQSHSVRNRCYSLFLGQSSSFVIRRACWFNKGHQNGCRLWENLYFTRNDQGSTCWIIIDSDQTMALSKGIISICLFSQNNSDSVDDKGTVTSENQQGLVDSAFEKGDGDLKVRMLNHFLD